MNLKNWTGYTVRTETERVLNESARRMERMIKAFDEIYLENKRKFGSFVGSERNTQIIKQRIGVLHEQGIKHG